jgi:hypothetical protein
MGLGIQYFPLGGVAPASCNAAYDQPDVPIVTLPQNVDAFTRSLAAHAPAGSVSLGPALKGALDYMKTWVLAHPGRTGKVVVFMASSSTECEPLATADIAALAAAAQNSIPPVRTYVIGLGNLVDLNAIADAGGTQKAFLLTGQDPRDEMLSALLSVIGAVPLSVVGTVPQCSFRLPAPTDGTAIDFDLVSVRQYPSGSSNYPEVPRVPSDADCSENGGFAWHFDSDSSPSVVVLCPKACAAGTDEKTLISLGCAPTRLP